jgi:hypothetical protein
VILRKDHVAGGVFIVAGALIFFVSSDLPFGTLASPGAGMMPKLVIAIMSAFGIILFMRAGESAPLADIDWGDFRHAARVLPIAAAAIALYATLGFLLTISLMLFGLLFMMERKHILRAAIFSIGVSGFAYILFGTLLKSPLPRGLIGF